MTGWSNHTGTAVVLPRENVDTDQIIPARFMATPRSEGYGPFLFHDLRDEGFPTMRVPGAEVLVAGRNFGCGSSREAAVYALVDAGIRAVIAPSFGDIFAGNAVNNGLLPARVDDCTAVTLVSALGTGQADLTLDIPSRRIMLGDLELSFELPDPAATKLIYGGDDIDLTRAHAEHIESYRASREATAQWVWPRAG